MLKECWFCGTKLKDEEICEYIPNGGKHKDDLYEEQCPYCGYHNTFLEEENTFEYYERKVRRL